MLGGTAVSSPNKDCPKMTATVKGPQQLQQQQLGTAAGAGPNSSSTAAAPEEESSELIKVELEEYEPRECACAALVVTTVEK